VVECVVFELGGFDLFVNNVGINLVVGLLVDFDLVVVCKIVEINIILILGWI